VEPVAPKIVNLTGQLLSIMPASFTELASEANVLS
jgi:hypothetical protein